MNFEFRVMSFDWGNTICFYCVIGAKNHVV
jgi:hypothetical protein